MSTLKTWAKDASREYEANKDPEPPVDIVASLRATYMREATDAREEAHMPEIIAAYAFTPAELEELQIALRGLRSPSDDPWSEDQARFLLDLTRTLEDAAIAGYNRTGGILR